MDKNELFIKNEQKQIYRSQRCHKCGFVLKANKTVGKKFKCNNCKFETNSDYNKKINKRENLPLVTFEFKNLQMNLKGFFWKLEGFFNIDGTKIEMPKIKIQKSAIIKNNELEISKEENPWNEMSTIRAQSLVTGEPICYPDKLIEAAKNTLSENGKQLWNDIEELGGYVHTILEYKKNYFEFKISTPIATYLDGGSYKEIINLVKTDIKLNENAKCPFCNEKYDYGNHDFYGNSQCKKCGAFSGSISENFAKLCIGMIFSDYKYDGILTVLKNWDNIYIKDVNVDRFWLNLNLLRNDRLDKIPLITGPELNKHRSIKIPVLINPFYNDYNTNEKKEIAENAGISSCEKCIGTCENCQFCLKIETENMFNEVHKYCIYPIIKNDFINLIGFNFDDVEVEVLWNEFIKKFLERFFYIDNFKLKAMYVQNGKKIFYAPICSNFKLLEEKETYGFDWNSNIHYVDIDKSEIEIFFGSK